MQKKNLVLGIVGVLALAIAAYMFFGYGSESKAPSEVVTFGVCLNCKHDQRVEHGVTDRAPFKCEECGEMAVYPWWFCSECNRRFVPALERDDEGVLRVTPFPACPECRTRAVNAYIPQFCDGKLAGTIDPPAWAP